MLSYAFWHWKQDHVPRDVYEARQREFQSALAADPPAGFLQSTVSRLIDAPWAAGGGPGYEDWYLVRDMASLAPLNEAAVSGSRRAPHDAAARLAAGGAAGLYGLKLGAPLRAASTAVWFGKPQGMSYPALFALVEPLVQAGSAVLWMRQMVLGPTPEFCLQSSEPVAVPPPLAATVLRLEPVWPAG